MQMFFSPNIVPAQLNQELNSSILHTGLIKIMYFSSNSMKQSPSWKDNRYYYLKYDKNGLNTVPLLIQNSRCVFATYKARL